MTPAGQLKVSASLEDYLEAIYHTVETKGAARAKDIVQRMGVHNSSVTQALRSLAEKHLVNYAPYDVITLTTLGQQIAMDVVHRHTTLNRFLTNVLGMDAEAADAGACRLEHAVDRPVMDRLVKFMQYMETCPLAKVEWDEELGFVCQDGAEQADQENCSAKDCTRRQ